MDHQKKLTPRAKEMYALIERYFESGLSQKLFCKQHGITYSTFHWWQYQYKKYCQNSKATQLNSEDFIPVRVSSPIGTNSASHSCQIEYPNGIIVHLRDVNVQFISELIRWEEQ